jgi:hypothetical protein
MLLDTFTMTPSSLRWPRTRRQSARAAIPAKRRWHGPPARYKGRALELLLTYDLEERTRSGSTAFYPKVKKTYIVGKLRLWSAGVVRKKSGREVHGVLIEYERNGRPARRLTRVVELPRQSMNVRLYIDQNGLPERYYRALHGTP